MNTNAALDLLADACNMLRRAGLSRPEIIRRLLTTAAIEMILARSPECVDNEITTPAVEAAEKALKEMIG